jgi:H+/gluconate symporter-like permease
MVEAATQSCPTPLATPSGAATSAADSLAALSTAFTYGSILLGILVLVAGWAWGKFIAMDAEREATKAARERADEHIQAWLAKEAPGIIRSRVDFILDSTLGSGNDADAADDLGKNAG